MKTTKEMDFLKRLDRFSPSEWIGWLHSMFYYVKTTGGLPHSCQNCFKVMATFRDETLFEEFKRKTGRKQAIQFLPESISISKKRYRFKVIQSSEGGPLMVIYADNQEDCDKIIPEVKEVGRRKGIRCRVWSRKGGRYWQDMFPELFGQSFSGYRPFYREYFDFRKKAEKLSSKELAKKVEEEIGQLESI